MDQQNNPLEEVVDRLCCSFALQCDCYVRLWEITRKAAGALAMSRGDFTTVLSVLSEKEELLNSIVSAKESVIGDIALWQEQKHSAPEESAKRLDTQLDQVEQVIRRFLSAEKQLEKQITFYQKGNT